MQQYIQEREKREKTSRLCGIALTVGVHLIGVCCFAFTGIKYLYPPPPEQTFLIDFTEEEDQVQVRTTERGNQPQAEEIDRSREIELVQRAESPEKAVSKNNLTPATAPDPHGDVEVPAPEQEEKLDPRAAFPGMGKKDTTLTAPHGAENPSATFKAGQPKGNTNQGRAEGAPNAHLEGRSVQGALPKPVYNSQEEGIVVVTINVDQYGTVTKATAGAEGTTVTDKNLWNAARNAAMKAHFSQSAEIANQTGTITYIFKLK